MIPKATVTRLADYLRVLASVAERRILVVSSEDLAVASGVGSATLRKDLSFLGPMGVRGVGYDVARLRARIELALGLDRGHRVVLVGLGNLGSALVGYDGFARRGFTVVGLFDVAPDLVGRTVAVGTAADGYTDLTVRHVDELVSAAIDLGATVGVVATPDAAAQSAVDALVDAGIECILSFASIDPVTPPHVDLRRVDLAVELQILSFANAHKAQRARPVRATCRDASILTATPVDPDRVPVGAHSRTDR
ncbi:redox-sensing transcriptional repressor Rex [Rhodococcus corynebacterioides]|uniref:Redox-sensing transcriptional repressor Rex n=2 Tax=Rhodococcoides corynebacterioides TaxID=53972 RepID=A0ABS7P525_9NOCA|nr:redox-sensing transcriptional repressor Rex [Rhodococcus corynebacterioides]MBY6367121.1 redox-sensing transcriptional repressor Rex [Rhodococcus corynebacterioides]MBY6407465.1 redox-sensing transcriptional repressor Rex [Rhodococcus corynebacterioides]